MPTALRLTARVQAGHRIEIITPELAEGEDVDVFVVMPDAPKSVAPAATAGTLMEFLDSLPPGPRSAPTWEAVERNLQEERESWDR